MDPIHEKLKPLQQLVGSWKTTGIIHATLSSSEKKIHGTDIYAWLPGEYFMLHTVDVWMGDDRNQTHEVIGYEKEKDFFFTNHFDNKGVAGTMIIMVREPLWVIHGGTLRFTGGFTLDNQEFSGIWEQVDEAKNWMPFMEIRLVREEKLNVLT
jgi:hypothetical protein